MVMNKGSRHPTVSVHDSSLTTDTLIESLDGIVGVEGAYREPMVILAAADLSPENTGPCFPVMTSSILAFLQDGLRGTAFNGCPMDDELSLAFGPTIERISDDEYRIIVNGRA